MESGLLPLVQLWEVDREIRSMQRELRSYPIEEKRRQERIDRLQEGADRVKVVIDEFQRRVKEIEDDVNTWKERITKLEREAYGSRDNSTLYAFQHQIQTLRGEIGERDDEGLKHLEHMAERQSVYDAEMAKVEAEQKVLGEFRENVAREKGQLEEKIAKLTVERNKFVPDVSPAHLNLYEKLLASSDRQPLAAVVQRTCQNCFTELTLNDFARVRSNKIVVQCKSCHCILYTT